MRPKRRKADLIGQKREHFVAAAPAHINDWVPLIQHFKNGTPAVRKRFINIAPSEPAEELGMVPHVGPALQTV